jgi:hypothetical protein
MGGRMKNSGALLLMLFALSTVVACGGGGGNGSSGGGSSASSSSSSTGVTVVASIREQITTATPSVTLAGIANVNFANQPDVLGNYIVISEIIDADINTLAESQSGIFNTRFTNASAIQIETSIAPNGDVEFTLFASELVKSATGNNQYPAAYFLLVDNSIENDGDNTIVPLPTVSDDAKGTITGKIPPHAFQRNTSGQYVATIKSGIFTESSLSPSSQRNSMTPSSSSMVGVVRAGSAVSDNKLKLPCPLSYWEPKEPPQQSNQPQAASTETEPIPCVETSRFNLRRSLDGGSISPHLGVDFRSKSPMPVFVPEGGVPIPSASYTEDQYNRATNYSCFGPQWKDSCKTVNYRAGIALVLDYGSYRIRIIHLRSIDPLLLTGTQINPAARTSNGKSVALTGGTGAGFGDRAHLHYTVFTKDAPICHIARNGIQKCTGNYTPVDPFPLMVDRFLLKEVDGEIEIKLGKKYRFNVNAYDYQGVEMISQVGGPQENRGMPPTEKILARYDPTRKVCLKTDPTLAFDFPDTNNVDAFLGIEKYFCAPWGKDIPVTSLVDRPTTTVTARFSRDPTVAVWEDSLSEKIATYDLLYLRETIPADCRSYSKQYFFATGQICPFWISYNRTPFSVEFVSSDDAIVTAKTTGAIDADGRIGVQFIAGSKAGIATVDTYTIDSVWGRSKAFTTIVTNAR